MSSLRLRVIVMLVLLGGAAWASRILYPEKMEHANLQAVALPLFLGGWVGVDVPVEAYVKQILETDDVVQRDYTNLSFKNVKVQMAIVFSPSNRRVAHPPDICYTGGGWEINGKQDVQLEGLPPMKQLQISHGRVTKEVVLYAFKSGPMITSNYLRQQYNIVKNQLTGGASSSALLRFSTPLQENESDADAVARMAAFIRAMMPEILKTLI